MDTKAAFEKWWEDQCEQLPPKMMAFSAWLASRAAIEIDLEHLCYVQVEEGTFYLDEGSVEALLTSHGIRIKGKTE